MLGANIQGLTEATALRAERLAARTAAKVLALDIVARVTVRIVVVNAGLNRMPGRTLCHNRLLFLTC